MMKQRQPMKRGVGFKRHEPAVPREDRPMAPIRRLERTPNYAGRTSGEPIEKENAIESEPYRRLVAAMPCCHCGLHGYSQAAHPPPTGKSRKEDDRACFPLCTIHPDREGTLVEGCHFRFDQYQLMPHDRAVERAKQWGQQTRARIANSGNWPANVPVWEA